MLNFEYTWHSSSLWFLESQSDESLVHLCENWPDAHRNDSKSVYITPGERKHYITQQTSNNNTQSSNSLKRQHLVFWRPFILYELSITKSCFCKQGQSHLGQTASITCVCVFVCVCEYAAVVPQMACRLILITIWLRTTLQWFLQGNLEGWDATSSYWGASGLSSWNISLLCLHGITRFCHSEHAFSYHCYADDTQLYLSYHPDDPTIAARISACLMQSSHCMILARFFTRRQVLINRRQMPEIGGKSVLVHASDKRAVWIIKDAIWGNRRCVTDAHEIFGMLNIWSCRRFTILLCEMSSAWKIHRDDLQPMREQDTGQREVRGGLFFFFFFTKRLKR